MSKMKDYMIDVEEQVIDAIAMGAKNESDVLAYVKTNMSLVDDAYVSKLTTEIMGKI
jgi:hypothetical protein